MNSRNFGYRFVLTYRTVLLGVALFSWPAAPRSMNVALTSTAEKTEALHPYHTLTMECLYPDGAAVSLKLAAERRQIPQKQMNSLKNCLEPRPPRWTAVI